MIGSNRTTEAVSGTNTGAKLFSAPRLLPIAVLAALVAACGPRASVRPALGESFQLGFGETARIGDTDLRLTFEEVLDDSRCPTGVVCVWAGNASVLLTSKEFEAALNTAVEPFRVSQLGYSVQLIAVEPYPSADDQLEPLDYVVTLVVTEE